MNQAIQVLDGCEYSKTRKALKIEVLCAGQIVPCYMSGQNKAELVALYENRQFDIEDVIEQLLKENKIDLKGELHFDANSLNVI